MKTLELKIEIGFCSVDELKEADRELVEAARQATANSYSPYSHFSVGAALRLSDGEIIIGANQENAAFPSVYVPNGRPCLRPKPNVRRNRS